jgi:hypothetical protein
MQRSCLLLAFSYRFNEVLFFHMALQNFLTDADGGGGPNGVQDGATPTPSPLPVRHSSSEEPERSITYVYKILCE